MDHLKQSMCVINPYFHHHTNISKSMVPMKSITSGAPSARAKRSTFLSFDEKQPSEDLQIRMKGLKNDSKTQSILVGLTNMNLR